MKAVFLLLLLLNALYFGWRLWIVPPAAPPVFVEGTDVPRLVLAGEDPDAVQTPVAREPGPDEAPQAQLAAAAAQVDAASQDTSEPGLQTTAEPENAQQPQAQQPRVAQPEPSGQPIEVAVSSAPRRCVSLGPFQNLREATEATAMLNEIGLQPSQRLAESQVWFGHWVHLPNIPTRAEAIGIVENLRAQGISDIYIEPSGPFRNYISLGVFSDAAHAETRAGQIRRLGVSPAIRDRYRDSSVYWVDFELSPEQAIDPAAYQSSPSRVLRLEGRDCPADT